MAEADRASAPQWIPDQLAPRCSLCTVRFGTLLRKHHCRACGQIFCHQCSLHRIRLPEFDIQTLARVCMRCYKDRGIEETYDSENFTARYFLRQKTGLSLVSPLFDSFRRHVNEKSMFLVRNAQGEELLLTQISKGPFCALPYSKSESARRVFLKIIFAIKHPYILPIDTCEFVQNSEKVVFLSKFCKRGSLRDYMHKANPKSIYGIKYRNQSVSPLSFHEISLFGRQILEALIYLKERKFKILHFHSGNILIEGNSCFLSGVVENELLGIKPFVNFDFDFDFDRLIIAYEVFCFGRVLCEMSTGKVFTKLEQIKTTLEKNNLKIPTPIFEILSLIFFPKNNNSLTLEEIFQSPVFSNVKLLTDIKYIHQIAFDSKCYKCIHQASDIKSLESLFVNKRTGKCYATILFPQESRDGNTTTMEKKSSTKNLDENEEALLSPSNFSSESNDGRRDKIRGKPLFKTKSDQWAESNFPESKHSNPYESPKMLSGEKSIKNLIQNPLNNKTEENPPAVDETPNLSTSTKEEKGEDENEDEIEKHKEGEERSLQSGTRFSPNRFHSASNQSMSAVLQAIKSSSSFKLRQTNLKWK